MNELSIDDPSQEKDYSDLIHWDSVKLFEKPQQELVVRQTIFRTLLGKLFPSLLEEDAQLANNGDNFIDRMNWTNKVRVLESEDRFPSSDQLKEVAKEIVGPDENTERRKKTFSENLKSLIEKYSEKNNLL